MHALQVECCEVEQAVFVLRIFALSDFVLFDCPVALPGESVGATEICSQIGVVQAETDGFLILLNRFRPVVIVEIPVGQGLCRLIRGLASRVRRTGNDRGRWQSLICRVLAVAWQDYKNKDGPKGKGYEAQDNELQRRSRTNTPHFV